MIGHGSFSACMTNAAAIMERRFSVARHTAEITFRASAALRTDQYLFPKGGIHTDHIIRTLSAGVTPEGVVHALPAAEFFLHHGDDLPFTFSAASGAGGHGGEETSFCAIYRIICFDIIAVNPLAADGTIQRGKKQGCQDKQKNQN